MKVADAMTLEVQLCTPDDTLKDVAEAMLALDVGLLPVTDGDRLIGMITDRDIAVRAVADGRAPGNTSVRDVMSEGVGYCFEDDDAEAAAQIMAKYQVRRLPVLNRDKRLVGVIALADLGRAEARSAQGALQGVSEATDRERRHI